MDYEKIEKAAKNRSRAIHIVIYTLLTVLVMWYGSIFGITFDVLQQSFMFRFYEIFK
jgi:hypothetical protein